MRNIQMIEKRMLSEEECEIYEKEFGYMGTYISSNEGTIFRCDKFTTFDSNIDAMSYFQNIT